MMTKISHWECPCDIWKITLHLFWKHQITSHWIRLHNIT